MKDLLVDADELKRKLLEAQGSEYEASQPKRDRLAVVQDLIGKKERRIKW